MGILDKITKKKDDKEAVEKGEQKKAENKETKKEVEKQEAAKKRPPEKKENKSSRKAKKIDKGKMPVHYFELIKKPHISEKALSSNAENKYVFVVLQSANKTEIKKAIGSLYGVIVRNVNIVKVPTKPKRFRGMPGVKSGYKKAIITLSKGDTIDIMKEKK